MQSTTLSLVSCVGWVRMRLGAAQAPADASPIHPEAVIHQCWPRCVRLRMKWSTGPIRSTSTPSPAPNASTIHPPTPGTLARDSSDELIADCVGGTDRYQGQDAASSSHAECS